MRHFKQAYRQHGGPARPGFKPEGDFEGVNFESVVQGALRHDPAALAALSEVGTSLGTVITNLVNIFNPLMVVLGGALVRAIDVLLPVIETEVAAKALSLSSENLRIVTSALDRMPA